MVKPACAVDVARKSYKNTSVRVIPYYDGTNDVSNYRLDILYGVRLLDYRLATRLSGSPEYSSSSGSAPPRGLRFAARAGRFTAW
jgi:hypothetical protein